ncbi:MAG: hypothetical protein OEW98_00015 [Betaproteobacteria bacterium]|nr:hypothetical protein [Betaproteobacteria bacterium]
MVGEKEYTLRPRTNAIRALQQRTGKTYGEILRSFDDFDVEATTQFLFAVLQPYHAKEIKHIDQAGDLMDDAGGILVVKEVLLEMLKANMPPAKLAPKDGEDRPRQAATDGTGDASGSTPAPAA